MKRNKDVFSEFVVGVFMVAVLALLAYFTIVISGVDLLLGRARVQTKVAFSDVGGLKDRDSVIYRGMKVGTVERIDLGTTNILVTLFVDRDVVLRDTCRVSVEALSLLGGNYLLLEEGTGAVKPLETTLFHGEPPVNFLRDAGRLVSRLGRADGGLSTILPDSVKTNLEQTMANLNTLVARLEKGEGTLGKLLSKDDTIYTDLRKTMANAASVSERLEKGEGTLGKLLSKDDTVYVDLRKTMANAAAVSERLARGDGVLGELLATNGTLRADFTATLADLKATFANLRATTDRMQNPNGLLTRLSDDKELSDNAAQLVSNLKTVSARLEKGEGTLGKLTTDSTLHDEISALVKDIRQIVDNYRDTTPITTFGALATGAL